MKIEIQIDERCDEPKIVVKTHKVTEEISEILKKLSEDPSEMLAGFRDERASIAARLRKKLWEAIPSRMSLPQLSIGIDIKQRSFAVAAHGLERLR